MLAPLPYKPSMAGKQIVIDNITESFLNSLRSMRENARLTRNQVAEQLNLSYSTILNYENRKHTPTLIPFMQLAQLFDADVSDSLNYRFFFRRINPMKIKARIQFLGLSMHELSSMTGYTERQIRTAINVCQNASIICLAAVLAAIDRETTAYQLTENLFSENLFSQKRK